jgi:hypothetical protein
MKQSIHVGLIGLTAVLCLVCSQPTQIEYGTLVVGIRWEPILKGSLNTSAMEIDHRKPKMQLPQKAAQAGDSVEWSTIRFTLQPGNLVFEFNELQESYAIQAQLGIYDLTVEVINDVGKIVYKAFYAEVLIEPNKINEIQLTLEPNFPAIAPEFVNLLPYNVNNNGSYTLSWTSVQGAESYTLNEDDDSTFASPVVPYAGPDTAFTSSDKQDGKYYYRVQANNPIGMSPWSAPVAFQVIRAAVLTLKTGSLPDGQTGVFYIASICAEGGTGPYSWEVTAGSLPPGLDGTQNGCYQISGIPTAAGTYTFTLEVNDNGTPKQSATKQFSINISTVAPALSITTASLSAGQVGAVYNQTVNATGGTTPYAWSVSSGTLPTGLSINPSTGVISGTPSVEGTSTFTVQVTDNGTPKQSATKQFSINISTVTPALSITTMSLSAGQVGTAYNQTVNATGGTTPYAWSVSSGTPPTGLSINPSTGVINGTPSAAGTFNFTVQVADAGDPTQSDTQSLSITINPAPLQITTSTLPNVTAGTSYSVQLYASGGTPPYTWSEISRSPAYLAEGINFSSGGLLSGTIYTQPHSGQITLRVTDSGGSPQTDTKIFNLNVLPGNLELLNAYLPEGQVGMEYWGYIVYRLGTSPLQSPWTITGGLPLGLFYNYEASNYQLSISSWPIDSGTFNFSVTIRDSGSPQKTRTDSFTLIVNP